MADITLTLEKRTLLGRYAKKVRRSGLVPSTVYGGKAKPVSTQSPLEETTRIIRAVGRHTPVHVVIDGKKKLAIIKSVDVDPVKHYVRHVAFHAIKQNEKIVTEVPIELTGEGESEAEKAGLIVLQAIEKVEVRALPAHLPEVIELSIASLGTTDDKLTVADITLPEGVEFADNEQDTELVIANVYEPSALQAANEAAAGVAESEDEVESENGGEETELVRVDEGTDSK
jgi:large subunit ribosomal protein L25